MNTTGGPRMEDDGVGDSKVGSAAVVPTSYNIESVDKAARIILALRHKRSLRVIDVANQLGVGRSTAHRLLATLQAHDLIKQDPATKAYGPGSALVELGIAVVGGTDLRVEVSAELKRLVESTGETAHFLVLQGNESVFVDGVDGTHVIRAAVRVGQRGPAHASAAGKVLLSHLAPDELRSLYPSNSLTGGTSRAIRTRRELDQELRRVREQGYAVNLAESEPGLYAVSVAVEDARGQLRGALSLSGPANRLGDDLEPLVENLRDAAARLARRLT